MSDRVLLADGAIDLRLGRWQDVLADVVECDAVITDPPYVGAATRGGVSITLVKGRSSRMGAAARGGGSIMGYAPLTREQASDLVSRAKLIARHRIFIFNDWPGWSTIWPMLHGDGWRSPCHPVVWAKPPGTFLPAGGSASLPKSCEFAIVGFRVNDQRGSPSVAHYTTEAGHRRSGDMEVVGGKPLGLMRAIVRDYTRPGDLVVDPFCGGGTTALACAMEGRRCITSEVDPVTFEKARKRLERGHTPDMFSGAK